jgi:hypothetical protein
MTGWQHCQQHKYKIRAVMLALLCWGSCMAAVVLRLGLSFLG